MQPLPPVRFGHYFRVDVSKKKEPEKHQALIKALNQNVWGRYDLDSWTDSYGTLNLKYYDRSLGNRMLTGTAHTVGILTGPNLSPPWPPLKELQQFFKLALHNLQNVRNGKPLQRLSDVTDEQIKQVLDTNKIPYQFTRFEDLP